MRLLWLFLIAGTGGVVTAQPLTITFRGVAALPNTATDQFGTPFTITGLSGVCGGEVADPGLFRAVMDNSNKVLAFRPVFASNGSITSVTMLPATSIAETRDFEGIAAEGTAFLAEESTPAVRAYALQTGSLVATLSTPAVFANIRPNFGFESLTGRPSNGAVWTANEEALTVDGPASSSNAGTVVRLLKFVGPSLLPGPQYAYITDPWHGSAISGARSGVSDMVLLPDGRMLVLERSFAFSLTGFFQTRIYEVDFTGATDVSSLPGLIGQNYTPVTKHLLYQGDQQNMEGLAIGPRLGPGRYAMVGIVDDGDPISVNRLVAFELSGSGPPQCYANCDGSNDFPVLNANDFQCYINSFAAGTAYANCDGSTAPPVLTANDFQCFLSAFAAGCQ